MTKNVKLTELNANIVTAQYTNLKDNLIKYKCLRCNKNYQKKFDKKLNERFFNTSEFSLTLISKSLFYCCEKVFTHVNAWMIKKKFTETSLREKEDFSGHLNIKDIL